MNGTGGQLRNTSLGTLAWKICHRCRRRRYLRWTRRNPKATREPSVLMLLTFNYVSWNSEKKSTSSKRQSSSVVYGTRSKVAVKSSANFSVTLIWPVLCLCCAIIVTS